MGGWILNQTNQIGTGVCLVDGTCTSVSVALTHCSSFLIHVVRAVTDGTPLDRETAKAYGGEDLMQAADRQSLFGRWSTPKRTGSMSSGRFGAYALSADP